MLPAHQDRAVKTMALKCVSACITTYLHRTAPEARGRDLPSVLRQTLGAVLGLLRKNAFQAAEQRARDSNKSFPHIRMHAWLCPATNPRIRAQTASALGPWILRRPGSINGYPKLHPD